MKNIFIVGEQRSGSNLLRLMLDQVDGLCCPHPPHILQRFSPIVDLYGDLSSPARFLRLAEDLVELVRRNPVRWEGFDVSATELAARCSGQSLVALYDAAMGLHAERQGASLGWVCKSMQNVRWFKEIEEHFDRPLYIHLYRDPRDVAASFRKAVVGSKHPWVVASKWAELQELCLQAGELAPTRFFPLSYESLVSSPREVAVRLCSFLGVEFEERMLRFHDSEAATAASAASSLWRNVSKPVMGRNFGKFRRELSGQEIALVEKAAGHLMPRLGYRLESSTKTLDAIEVGPDELSRFEVEDAEQVRDTLSSMDPEDRKARNWQESLLSEIRRRLSAAVPAA